MLIAVVDCCRCRSRCRCHRCRCRCCRCCRCRRCRRRRRSRCPRSSFFLFRSCFRFVFTFRITSDIYIKMLLPSTT